MVSSAATRRLFRVAFVLYALGLIGWLLLGLLPTLAEIGAVRDMLRSIEGSGGALGAAAGRVLHPTMAEHVTIWVAVEQYAFSALNLGLGLLLVARRPDEVVPRLLGLALLGTAATFNMPSHRAFHIIATPGPVKFVHFSFHIVSGVAYLWAVVLFPDGRLPARLRLPAAAQYPIAAAVTAVAALIGWRGSFLAHPQFFVVFFGVAVSLVGVGAQSLRLADRATPAAERRPARLLIAALLPSAAIAVLWLGGRVAVGLGSRGAVGLCDNVQTLFPLVFAIVPVVLFAGVVRYRLWDIDRLLSRVLVFAIIATIVSTVYVVVVAASGRIAGGGLWSTVLALAVAATLVEPLRVVSRRWANRVVFGQVLSPLEANRVLAHGLEHLSPTGEIDQIAVVAHRATRARAAQVWLADGGVWRRIACAPPDGAAEPVVHGDLGAAVGLPLWPISHQGERLGALVVQTDGERLPAADVSVAERIAAHAGLVLHNAVLTTRLAEQVARLAEQSVALREARRRLVAAQDFERRRLERDLHDGAQQALVAAVITAGSGPSDDLAEILEIARTAVAELSGGRPTVLAEHGLDAALRAAASLAARSGLRVTVDVDASGMDPDVEAAVYFCCAEALQNVVKHARARSARVSVRTVAGLVQFTVTDDGRGVDPAAVDVAGGVRSLAARVAVLGGTIMLGEVETGGASLRGSVPARVAVTV